MHTNLMYKKPKRTKTRVIFIMRGTPEKFERKKEL